MAVDVWVSVEARTEAGIWEAVDRRGLPRKPPSAASSEPDPWKLPRAFSLRAYLTGYDNAPALWGRRTWPKDRSDWTWEAVPAGELWGSNGWATGAEMLAVDWEAPTPAAMFLSPKVMSETYLPDWRSRLLDEVRKRGRMPGHFHGVELRTVEREPLWSREEEVAEDPGDPDRGLWLTDVVPLRVLAPDVAGLALAVSRIRNEDPSSVRCLWSLW